MSLHPSPRLLYVAAVAALTLCLAADLGRVRAQAEDPLEDPDEYLVFNVAAAANGGSATASSTLSASYPAASLVNGDRKGTGWGAGTGGWHDATWNAFPDYVEIQFAGPMSITEVDIVTLQDNYTDPVEPTLETTFANFGARDFNVWYRGTDGQWYLLWSVVGNNRVLRSHRFSAVAADRVRVEVLGSPAAWHNQIYSRLVEVEVWGRSALKVIAEPAEEEPPGPGPTPTPEICKKDKPSAGLGPCESARNLQSAMEGNRTGPLPYGNHIADTKSPYYRTEYWTDTLKWNYSTWRTNGTQNVPVQAHALALWREPVEYGRTSDTAALNWWITYLDCQTGNPCNVVDPRSLQYFKASELFSNTYDAETTAAVIAAHVWAAREYALIPNSARRDKVRAVLDKSRSYLQMNWRLYALAAGKGPAARVYNRFNHGDGPDAFDNPLEQVCHKNYNGPFIALAGMRSTPQHTCADDRGPLLARALAWAHSGPTGTKHVKALLVRSEIVKAEANQLPNAIFTGESAYALASGVRAMLRRHINGTPNAGEDTTNTILGALQSVRPGVTFHFIGARADGVSGQEARLTLMEDNMTQETAATFGVTYDYTRRLARILFPWTNRGVNPSVCATSRPVNPWRSTVTRGHANLRPTENSPASLFGSSSNRDGTSSCKNQENGVPVTEEFALPANWHLYYHVKFSPSGPPVRLR